MSRNKEIVRAFEKLFGQLITEGPQQARFWVRTFGLQEQMDYVQAKIQEKPERKKASVPAIGHYIADENLTWIYALHFSVDELGVQDVIGMVWYAAEKYKAEAFRRRDQLADQMMVVMEEKRKTEGGESLESPFDVEIKPIEPKKERHSVTNCPVCGESDKPVTISPPPAGPPGPSNQNRTVSLVVVRSGVFEASIRNCSTIRCD